MAAKDEITLLETMEIFSKDGAKAKKFMNRLNLSAVVVLAIGLALNKYVWKSYYLDAYAAGYAALVLLGNTFMMAMYVAWLETYKEYLPNAQNDDDE